MLLQQLFDRCSVVTMAIACALGLPGLINAEVLQYKNAKGEVFFSDQTLSDPGWTLINPLNSPDHSGQPVQTTQSNTLSAPKTDQPSDSNSKTPLPSNAAAETKNYFLLISDPSDQSTIPLGIFSLSVDVKISPEIDQGNYKIQCLLDGQLQQEIQNAHTCTLTDLPAGQHTLKALLWLPKTSTTHPQQTPGAVDYEQVAESPAVTIYQMRKAGKNAL